MLNIQSNWNNYFFPCGCRSRWIPCCRVFEGPSLWESDEAPKIFDRHQISYQCVSFSICLIQLFMKIKSLDLQYDDCILAAHKCISTGSLSFMFFVYIALFFIEKENDILSPRNFILTSKVSSITSQVKLINRQMLNF